MKISEFSWYQCIYRGFFYGIGAAAGISAAMNIAAFLRGLLGLS